ncbi:hypothetical protein [Streptobacillus ratti]|uniref:hypothetical protein n=1 Tax=Streptobacillus ratti TaxID=1720557 RepID=UPI0009334933|nr:hypothetical protein [Streptobacillus ratti]
MLKTFKGIERVVLNNKEFVMEHLECSESKALKLINQINRVGKMKHGKDTSVFGNGKTSLSWYWQYQGLKGEFV